MSDTHGVPPAREPIITTPTKKPAVFRMEETGRQLRYTLRQLYKLPHYSSWAILGFGQDGRKLAEQLNTLGDYFDIEAVKFKGNDSLDNYGVVVIYAQKQGQEDVTCVTLCMPPRPNLVQNYPTPEAYRKHIERLVEKNLKEGREADSYDLVATSHVCAMCMERFVRGDYAVPVHAKASGAPGSTHFLCLMDAGVNARDIFDIQDSIVIQEKVWKEEEQISALCGPVADVGVSRWRARELIWSVQRCPSERAHRLKWKKYRTLFLEHAKKNKSHAPAASAGAPS